MASAVGGVFQAEKPMTGERVFRVRPNLNSDWVKTPSFGIFDVITY
jgi:hypothetical protein